MVKFMSDRFKELYRIEPNQYQAGAPVMIAAGSLFQDTASDRILALLKMRSLSLKKIKAVSVILQPLDTTGKKLGNVIIHHYLDLQVNRADTFGQKQPIFMDDKITRQFTVFVKEAAFDDNSVWEADGSDAFTIKEPVTLLDYFQEDGELAKQYRFEYGTSSNFFPKDEGCLWVCSCGEFNTSAEHRCHACGNEKEKLFSFNLPELKKKKEERLNAESYENAVQLKTKRTVISLKKAVSAFRKLGNYKDSGEQVTICEAELEIIKAEEEEKKKAEEERRKAEAEKRLEEERQAELRKERATRKVKRMAVIASACIAFCIAFYFVLTMVIIPKIKLNKAMELIDSGDYETAYVLLEEIGNIEAIASNKYDRAMALIDSGDYDAAYVLLEEIDNNEAIASNKYDRAVALIGSGDYEAAYDLLEGLDYKDSTTILNSIKPEYKRILLSRAQPGAEVLFGVYEQDNNATNGKEDIEWLVLARDGDRVLLVSKYALDCQQYKTESAYVTWETCSLREWLNETFLKEAFSEGEQAMIPSVTVNAEKNPYYRTSAGNSTMDQVFLLSITEAKEYFSSNSLRTCKGTEYCYARGAYKDGSGECWWWLRSPGRNNYNASGVDEDGLINSGDVSSRGGVVRPALWVDLES